MAPLHRRGAWTPLPRPPTTVAGHRISVARSPAVWSRLRGVPRPLGRAAAQGPGPAPPSRSPRLSPVVRRPPRPSSSITRGRAAVPVSSDGLACSVPGPRHRPNRLGRWRVPHGSRRPEAPAGRGEGNGSSGRPDAGGAAGAARLSPPVRGGFRIRCATPGRPATGVRRADSGPIPAGRRGSLRHGRCRRLRESLDPVADSSWPSAPLGATRPERDVATDAVLPFAGPRRMHPEPADRVPGGPVARNTIGISRAGRRPAPSRPTPPATVCAPPECRRRSPSRRRPDRAAGGNAPRTPTG